MIRTTTDKKRLNLIKDWLFVINKIWFYGWLHNNFSVCARKNEGMEGFMFRAYFVSFNSPTFISISLYQD